MIKKTVGGDRLGSGNRMKAELHNYERSTHNMSTVWRSTMAPGVLVPCFKQLCQNGDTWTINTRELIRTMPAIGPCFGSYKLQIDFFEIPIRLYNGILHNNMTKIGMDMHLVHLPKFTLRTTDYQGNRLRKNPKTYQVNPSSLVAYLGVRGIGENSVPETAVLEREFNAVPMLAYYDIFKNYYANKQEEYAYVINTQVTEVITTKLVNVKSLNGFGEETGGVSTTSQININGHEYTLTTLNYSPGRYIARKENNQISIVRTEYQISFDGEIEMGAFNDDNGKVLIQFKSSSPTGYHYYDIRNANVRTEGTKLIVGIPMNFGDWVEDEVALNDKAQLTISGIVYIPLKNEKTQIKLDSFNLMNIEQMRINCLSNIQLGEPLNISNYQMAPYWFNCEYNDEINESFCKYPMQGLVVKTYQSDLFNAWLSKKWIDGIQGINAVSAVAVENGKIEINAINLAKKVYNMLNRIAISGGTYEDWQEAVYGDNAVRHAESPVYCGGASGIIAFEEVISTADTETAAAGDQPLGSLAGKGILTNVEGGYIEIHITEPSYIMAIASITPLIDYGNGNDFDMTEINTLDDMHKPELDEIGFQDLVLERAAWWTTKYDEENDIWKKEAGGKTPAWIEWMTNYNRVYGNFAEEQELDFMVLQRRYEKGTANDNNATLIRTGDPLSVVSIKDWTTYINPTKFNYQFADAELNAQNFWVQIGFDATVRRKISAKLIPNL